MVSETNINTGTDKDIEDLFVSSVAKCVAELINFGDFYDISPETWTKILLIGALLSDKNLKTDRFESYFPEGSESYLSDLDLSDYDLSSGFYKQAIDLLEIWHSSPIYGGNMPYGAPAPLKISSSEVDEPTFESLCRDVNITGDLEDFIIELEKKNFIKVMPGGLIQCLERRAFGYDSKTESLVACSDLIRRAIKTAAQNVRNKPEDRFCNRFALTTYGVVSDAALEVAKKHIKEKSSNYIDMLVDYLSKIENESSDNKKIGAVVFQFEED